MYTTHNLRIANGAEIENVVSQDFACNYVLSHNENGLICLAYF